MGNRETQRTAPVPATEWPEHRSGEGWSVRRAIASRNTWSKTNAPHMVRCFVRLRARWSPRSLPYVNMITRYAPMEVGGSLRGNRAQSRRPPYVSARAQEARCERAGAGWGHSY